MTKKSKKNTNGRSIGSNGQTGLSEPAPAIEPIVRRLFGTDGIRGRANVDPMTPELALRLGRAITLVAGRGKTRAPRIVIGKDTRLSGYMLETALAAGICAMGGPH